MPINYGISLIWICLETGHPQTLTVHHLISPSSDQLISPILLVKSCPHSFQVCHIWLVVWNMFLFSSSYMVCHPSHWRTHIFQDGHIAPPTSPPFLWEIFSWGESPRYLAGGGGWTPDGHARSLEPFKSLVLSQDKGIKSRQNFMGQRWLMMVNDSS